MWWSRRPNGPPARPSSRTPSNRGRRHASLFVSIGQLLDMRARDARDARGMIANLLILFEAPALGLQLLIDGILIGAVFALAAYGMALVWGVTNIVNVGA